MFSRRYRIMNSRIFSSILLSSSTCLLAVGTSRWDMLSDRANVDAWRVGMYAAEPGTSAILMRRSKECQENDSSSSHILLFVLRKLTCSTHSLSSLSQLSRRSWSRDLAASGSAAPPVFFITSPTKNPSNPLFPARYSAAFSSH